jgi:hypothetical protein
MYYASNDVVSLIPVPFGGKVAKIHILGVSGPQTAKIFPQTGKSNLKLKCLITFKREEIDKKL